jgi:epoxyqueuosine reductase
MPAEIIEKAKELGFLKIGFSTPQTPVHFDKFMSWLSGHKNADMSWMERHTKIREDPELLLKGCRTIISLAYPYSPNMPITPDGFSASRYSQPDKDDYHRRIRMLCNDLVVLLKDMHKGCKSRICIDSVPILERSIAYSSGIGFIGKNNMLIVPGYGSYLYLAEIMTTAPLDIPSIEPIENQCGSCTRCLDSCPSGALEEPFSLNASRCLSYLTIECKRHIDKDEGVMMGRCFFGCDRCQEVCPFNKGGGSREIVLPSTDELLKMDRVSFSERFGNTALARTGIEKIQMNIRAITRLRRKPPTSVGG